jgi:hypothetical protein
MRRPRRRDALRPLDSRPRWVVIGELTGQVVVAEQTCPPGKAHPGGIGQVAGGGSLAPKVIRAVDAPDRIAIMRFVPEVAATAQVFESYRTTATILTLVKTRVGPGVCRCSGRPCSSLGHAPLSARDILGQ